MKKPVQQKTIINGPVGQLEALHTIGPDAGSSVAVICHPHPLYGGTMTNKVVHYTARAFNEMGIPVLRFNFRGVGASDGEFDEARGEAEDLQACVRWMQSKYPGRQLLLAGFSFGAYVAAKMAKSLAAEALISIAPAVNLYDFRQIAAPACPWLVIQGDADEVVPVEEVRQWASDTPAVSRLVLMNDASHFFHGRLRELADIEKAWLDDAGII